MKPYTALVDTGADSTLISRKIVEELRLKIKGQKHLLGVTGKELRDYFLVCLHLNLDINSTNQFLSFFNNVTAISFEKNHNDKYDLLIGRDIISRGLFLTYDNHFVFCL